MSDYPDGEGKKQKLFLATHWGIRQGTDTELVAEEADKSFDQSVEATFTTSATIGLFITYFSWYCTPHDTADGDKPQQCKAEIIIAGDVFFAQGSDGGDNISFATPLLASHNYQVIVRVTSKANHAVDLGVTAQGYEE